MSIHKTNKVQTVYAYFMYTFYVYYGVSDKTNNRIHH